LQKLKAWFTANLQTLEDAKVAVLFGEYSGYRDEGSWEGTCFDPVASEENLDKGLRSEVGELLEGAYEEIAPYGYEGVLHQTSEIVR
jgi:hypothetical protein